MAPEEMPQTLMEAVRYFAELDRCREFMRAVKWPSGKVTCPKCASENCGEIATRKMLKCNDCDKQFSYTVGTVFEASKISLDKWFVGLWALVNCKNGISSYELGRAVGVPQKTAWFMIQRLRAALEIGGFGRQGNRPRHPAARRRSQSQPGIRRGCRRGRCRTTHARTAAARSPWRDCLHRFRAGLR